MDFLFEPIWKDFKKLQRKSDATYHHSIRAGDYAVNLFDKLYQVIVDEADKYICGLFENLINGSQTVKSKDCLVKVFNEEEIGSLRYKTYQAAIHHDIGKLNAPDEILNKNGKLSEEEHLELRSHPFEGLKMLVEEAKCEDKDILIGVYLSHERVDGRGYFGEKSEKINLIGRITAIADVFDAKVEPHVNGETAKCIEQAAFELIQDRGLDQHIVKNFIEMMGL